MAGEDQGTSPAASTIRCGNCGAPITIRAKGLTITAVCSSCGSFNEKDNEDFKLVVKAQAQMIKPSIALGTRGVVNGIRYEVIGFMRRYEPEYPEEPWDEFLLYNPFQGYGWLSEYHGHWNFYKMIKAQPKEMGEKLVSYLGTLYDVYHRGSAKVQFVVGEFYWQVRVGETVVTLDAIHPPHILSKEVANREVTWSDGLYIEPADIEHAFRPVPMPVRKGVAPDQPGVSKQLKGMSGYCVWAIIFLLAVQILGAIFNPEKNIQGQPVLVTPTGLTETEVAKFEITKNSGSALIHLRTALSNAWLTANVRVVPEDPSNSETHAFEKDLSFYYGSDSDGSWSEGSRDEDFLINTLPRGSYRVLLSSSTQYKTSNASFPDAQIDTTITTNSDVWSNFWLAFVLLILPPIITMWRFQSFERKRWSESEYSKYEHYS